ncbi:MAG: hypothetical protein IPM71_09590 [Bacteroidota bacterium]|nr:MAG: hypothetical protein IPM71_09590 [Bacteroidota bacterium]
MHLRKAYLLLPLISLLFLTDIKAQKIPAGGSLIYNLQTRGFGVGARAEFEIKQVDLLEGIYLVPQVAYFPGFNTIHEFYAGSSLHLGVYATKMFRVYALTNLSYNGWINHDESAASNAKFSNLQFDLGAGISGTKCWRPFFEYRYNLKWKEASLHLGLLYVFNCNQRGMVPCSDIPDAPKF